MEGGNGAKRHKTGSGVGVGPAVDHAAAANAALTKRRDAQAQQVQIILKHGHIVTFHILRQLCCM